MSGVAGTIPPVTEVPAHLLERARQARERGATSDPDREVEAQELFRLCADLESASETLARISERMRAVGHGGMNNAGRPEMVGSWGDWCAKAAAMVRRQANAEHIKAEAAT